MKVEAANTKPFPVRMVATMVALSIGLLIGLGWHTWNSYQQFKKIQEQDFRLQELAGIIVHLDEVLTMSARMAAATGDIEWEARYRSFEPQLDAVIKETNQLAPRAYDSEAAARTDAANVHLVTMENRVFALVRGGEREAAAKLLSSEEYAKQKRIYSQGIQNVTAAIKERLEANTRAQRGRLFLSVAAITASVLALIFAWIRVLRVVHRYLSERERAEEETRLHLQRITALQEINVATTSTLDLHSVLNVLMEKIELFLPYTALLVWLVNKESGLLERAACWNLDEKGWKERKLNATPALVRAALEGKTPVVAKNIQSDPRALDPDFYRRERVISYLGVPLIVKGEVLGVLVFLTREEHEFTQEEIEFLSTLAGQAAIAIHNSQLHEKTQSQAEKLEKANRDLKTREEIEKLLKELSQDIALLDIDNLLGKLTGKIREVFKVDISDVRVSAEWGWQVLGVSGIEPERLRRSGQKNPRGRSAWIVENRKPLSIPDISQPLDVPAGEVLSLLGLRGYLGVPLFSRGGEVIGILRALTYRPREFTQQEVDLLQQLANGAAIALGNARLLEQTKKQAVELGKVNKMQADFTAMIAHDLRAPLMNIIGAADMVKEGHFGPVNEEQKRWLSKIRVNGCNLVDLVSDFLDVSKMEAGHIEITKEEVDLRQLIQNSVEDYLPLVEGKNISIVNTVPSAFPRIKADSRRLSQVLSNLLSNAAKFTGDGGRIEVGAAQVNGTHVKVWVKDNGAGISPEELVGLFEKYRQFKGGRISHSKGTGLGLVVCKMIVEAHGGEIWADSKEGEGTTFSFTLPLSD